ncbi:MAG TPA: biotin attachment protein [Deltaproteobacteria bacterium]|nr:biotin attachment protein [Deltaproteobacteria bacterium]
MAKKRIEVMNTAFRDGFQSVFGARVLRDDFLPAVEAAREAGFTHFEAGGGARYQALYLYCQEDAFEMMDAFRRVAGPDANLQTLARGVNVVGLDSQSSDIIDLHARLFKKHGITTIRNFDALNDVRNLSYSGARITAAGLKHEVVVALMGLPPGAEGTYRSASGEEVPAHSPAFYTSILRQLLDAEVPFDSVCYKDASGTTPPAIVYESIRAARQLLGGSVHLRLHTHETAGISVACYRAALDAGADGIDLAMSPVSGGTSQPDVITMWQALRGSGFDLGLDIEKVLEAEAVLKECLSSYFIPPEATAVEPLIPYSPMPGGALTANTQMMRDNQMLDRYPAVIAAMGEVVRRGGFGTSVTPVSQFYFQQAFNNVVFGPWERIAAGYGKMVLGYFGRTPVPPDPEIVALASRQLELEPTTEDPRAINDADPDKGIASARTRLQAAGLPLSDENVFIASALLDKGIAFLEGRAPLKIRLKEAEARSGPPDRSVDRFVVTVRGCRYEVQVDGEHAIVDGVRYPFDVSGIEADGDGADAGAASRLEVRSELPGKVLRTLVQPGSRVGEGQPLLVLEALKMEIEVNAPGSGTVDQVSVSVGASVVSGDLLVVLR